MSEENKLWIPFHVVPFEVKQLEEKSDRYEFKGHASVFYKPDRIKDVMHPGAFKRTIDHNNGKFALDWMHETKEIIGGTQVHEDTKGLAVEPGYLVKGVQRAEETYLLMKAKVVDGMSFMYKAIQRKYERGHRHLHEVRIGSLTVGPSTMICHPDALITDVKFEDLLLDVKLVDLKNEMKFEYIVNDREDFKELKSFWIPGEEYRIEAMTGITSDGIQVKSLRFNKMAGWNESSIRDWIVNQEDEIKFLDIMSLTYYELAKLKNESIGPV